ncbi:MAG: hypothetical protein ACK5GN_04250 [Pseudomonadota bacterium]|jgi:hypothetical protein
MSIKLSSTTKARSPLGGSTLPDSLFNQGALFGTMSDLLILKPTIMSFFATIKQY